LDDRFYKECPGAIEPDPDTEEDKIIQNKGWSTSARSLAGWQDKADGCAT